MKLVVISHKRIWADSSSPSGYATTGGFPFQMRAISELFDSTTLMVPLQDTSLPAGAQPLSGRNLHVQPLTEPLGTDLRRKLFLLAWLPRNLPSIWRVIRITDAVHAPVPGDMGTLGLLVALAQRKPLFVRHCGTWGRPTTLADRFLFWLLESIAGGRNVILATGGGKNLPSQVNTNIHWIFSTTIVDEEMANLPQPVIWREGDRLHLVSVGRLAYAKNTQAILHALPLIMAQNVDVRLHIVGDGETRSDLERLADGLELREQIIFHGNVSHERVMSILMSSHVFVFPTRVREGFPKAVLEAMASGLPVVATAVSVIPILIQGCGRVLRDPNPRDLASVIMELIANPEEMAAMGARAQEIARAYTLERWRDRIGAHLHDAWGPLTSDTFNI